MEKGPEKYLLITMGGTIDAAPYPEKETRYPVNATMTGENRARRALREIFATQAQSCELDVIALCDKDSKDLDDNDRNRLAEIIAASSGLYKRIIVTMGTDRMCETGRDLIARTLPLHCPVIFTGAFRPLSNGARSDGMQNLRQATFSRPGLPPGIYITAGDTFGSAQHMIKDFEKGKFVDLSAKL